MTGPIAGTTYADVMVPMGMQTDEGIASVASYIRNGLGNSAPMVKRWLACGRRPRGGQTMWSPDELLASLPNQIVSDASWKFSASRNPDIAQYAIGRHPGRRARVRPLEPGGRWSCRSEGTITPGMPSRSVFGGEGDVPPMGYPRGCEVQVSNDGTTWRTVAQGTGTGENTHIVCSNRSRRSSCG